MTRNGLPAMALLVAALVATTLPIARGEFDGLTLDDLSGPRNGWEDSYAIDGKCYCQTTFDHNIGDVMVTDTSTGEEITVREACERVGEGPDGDRAYYNDIQCGNGPPNDTFDEFICPGRVDLGSGNQEGCNDSGPLWSFPGATETPPPPPPPPPPTTSPSPTPTTSPSPTPTNLAGVLGLAVVLPDGDATDLSPGEATVSISAYPDFGVRAEVGNPSLITSVDFETDMGYFHTERAHPYDMFGTRSGRSLSWPDPKPGFDVIVTVTVLFNDETVEVTDQIITLVD